MHKKQPVWVHSMAVDGKHQIIGDSKGQITNSESTTRVGVKIEKNIHCSAQAFS